MVKLSLLFSVVAALFSTIYGWQPGSETCKCFSLTYVDKPTNIAECSTKSTFVEQIVENFENLFLALHLNDVSHTCKFSEYKTLVDILKEETVAMVESYFSCTEADCTKHIMKAYRNISEFRINNFNTYKTCFIAVYEPECAQILIQAEPPVYESTENILTTLLSCVQLKSELKGVQGVTKEPNLLPTVTVASFSEQTTSSTASTDNPKRDAEIDPSEVVDCNCIEIDQRPIPNSKNECFSKEYISQLRAFVEVNFEKVFNEYNLIDNVTCAYMDLLVYINQLKEVALATSKLLEESNPNFDELNIYYERFQSLVASFRPAVRAYIVKNDKSCYFNVRATRYNPIAITSAVFAILTKCIGYVDVDYFKLITGLC